MAPHGIELSLDIKKSIILLHNKKQRHAKFKQQRTSHRANLKRPFKAKT